MFSDIMARRLNSIGLIVIIVLCILLIFATNRIPLSPFSQQTIPENEYMRTLALPHDRIQRFPSNPNDISVGGNLYANGRHNSKYFRIIHPNKIEHRTHQFSSNGRRFGNDATVSTTNNIIINTTARIEDVINAQRHRLAKKLKDFEYTADMGEGLKSLTPDTNGRPVQSLILSTWRSGSTFLGDIMNAMPGNFYHYEPLLNYEIVQIRGPPQSEYAIDTLRQLLKCNYSTLNDYLDYGTNHNYLFSHNFRLWRNCQIYPQFCYEPEFLNAFCRLFPFQSMKIVRLRLALAESLLNDKSLNVKMLLLVRDPRGTMQSRKHREWCPGQPDCDNSLLLCKDLEADYVAALNFTKYYPNKFKAVRYEDLSMDPFKITKEILNFFGLPFDPDVEEFLDSHTRTDIGGVSSTFRDSKNAPFHWMRDLSYDEVESIQLNCIKAMSLWGYKESEYEEELSTNTFNPVLKFPFS